MPDDTALLQSMLNKGGSIRLGQGLTYIVSKQDNETSALLIDSDTSLDLNGSTIILSPSSLPTSLFGQKNDNSVIKNINIVNGTIDGNGPDQPAPYVQFTPTIYLPRCDNLKLNKLNVNKGYCYGVYVKGSYGHIDELYMSGCVGGGVHVDGDRWDIGRVSIKDTTFFETINAQGNPFIVSLTNSEIGYVTCQNYAKGVKFQDGCSRVAVKSITAIAGQNNTSDYMVKIQGNHPNNPNNKITIDNIVAYGGPLSGLYIYDSFDVWINSYHGINNGNNRSIWENDAKNGADILMIKSDEISINEVRVEGFPIHGFWMQDEVGTFTAEEFISDRSLVNSVVVQEGVAILGNIHIRP